MEQVFRLLFVGLLGGLWLSLEEANCQDLNKGIYKAPECYNTSTVKTCFMILLANDSHPVRKPFKTANDWCNSKVPGFSLIIIDSLESLRNVESFIGRQELANETIITDAQKLSSRDSLKWSWVNGNETIPKNVSAEQLPGLDGACVESKVGQSLAYCTGTHQLLNRYICEYLESKSASSYRHNNRSFVASEVDATWYDARKECLGLGGDLATITNLQTMENWSQLKKSKKYRYWIGLHRNKWIWNSTGDEITYTNWKDGYPEESPDKQCICINTPQCRRENSGTICKYDRKWRTCNCNHNYTIVCQKQEETSDAITPGVIVTGKMLSSTSIDLKSSVSLSGYITTSSHSLTPSSSPSSSTLSTTKSSSKSSTTTRRRSGSKAIPITLTTTASTITINTSTTSSSTGLFKSFKTKEILLILFFVAVIFIVAAIIFIIRKRKYDRRNEGAYMKNITQSEAVSPAYTTVVPANRTSEGTVTSDNPIYAEVEMTQQSTPPSNNPIYASVQHTSEVVDMGKSIVYSDLNFPQKGKQKPRSADKITACLSPIYSEPYQPRTSATNTEYAEPFKPDKRPTATAPAINHNAAVDQQNVYPLAKAIPMGDPNVIYSQPNKPTKSSTPTDKAVKDPIYLNVIEVKPGAESGSVAIQDPTAVYAEPMTLKKSP